MLSADSPTPIQPIGSLTCVVYLELDTAVDASVTVNTVLSGPIGFRTTNTSQIVVEGTTIYSSTVIISSLGRNQSGDYTCTATLHSTLTNAYVIDSTAISDSIQVITGEFNLQLSKKYIIRFYRCILGIEESIHCQ